MSASADAREWHRLIRASVRECLETWVLQTQASPVTVEALEAITARSMVQLLYRAHERREPTLRELFRAPVCLNLRLAERGFP